LGVPKRRGGKKNPGNVPLSRPFGWAPFDVAKGRQGKPFDSAPFDPPRRTQGRQDKPLSQTVSSALKGLTTPKNARKTPPEVY